MRTIVVLLIAALVLTPALAHAAGGYGGSRGGGLGLVALVALPVLAILLLIDLEKKHPNWRDAETPSSLPGSPSESPSSTVPVPAVGSDR